MVLGSSKDKRLHTEDVIVNGKMIYHVKFIGVTEVSDSRGVEVMMEAMQKLKFNYHIKRSEGMKPHKVDLIINVKGFQLIDQRTKMILHDIPLHRVSFCADDKRDKRLFSFIAKGNDGKHYCYGLDSVHEANNITLTIGQAFELAYQDLLKSDKAVTSKKVIELSKRIETLEKENSSLKEKIRTLESSERRKPLIVPLLPSIPLSSSPATSVCRTLANPNQSATSVCRTLENPNQSAFLSSDHILPVSDWSTSRPIKITSKELTSSAYKQSSCDQNIASVEKAKASLNSLKEYVNKRKMQQQLKIDHAKLAADSPQNALPLMKKNILDCPQPAISENKICQEEEHGEAEWWRDEVGMDSVVQSIPMNSSGSNKDRGASTLYRDLPETEIGDFHFDFTDNNIVSFDFSCSNYENMTPSDARSRNSPVIPPKPGSLKYSRRDEDAPPTIPPKPGSLKYSRRDEDAPPTIPPISGSLMTSFVVDQSLYSASDGDLSPYNATPDPFDVTPDCLKFPAQILAVVEREVGGEPPAIGGERHRCMEDEGLTPTLMCSFNTPTVDSTYDSVCKLMQTVRCEERSNLSGSTKQLQIQPSPAVAEKDAFDMRPFTPPPVTPSFVRLPSPKEVYPLKSPNHLTSTQHSGFPWNFEDCPSQRSALSLQIPDQAISFAFGNVPTKSAPL